MNALAGWGFASLAALDRFARDVQCVEAAAAKSGTPRRQQRWVSQERLASYAETLTDLPPPWQIMQHFRCCYASALKHRRKIADLIAKRGKT